MSDNRVFCAGCGGRGEGHYSWCTSTRLNVPGDFTICKPDECKQLLTASEELASVKQELNAALTRLRAVEEAARDVKEEWSQPWAEEKIRIRNLNAVIVRLIVALSFPAEEKRETGIEKIIAETDEHTKKMIDHGDGRCGNLMCDICYPAPFSMDALVEKQETCVWIKAKNGNYSTGCRYIILGKMWGGMLIEKKAYCPGCGKPIEERTV